MLTYQKSDWAVRTWDWFNGGRQVEPKSFCQFWRTVVLYATVKRLLLAATFPARPMFSRAVIVGERMEAFEKRHHKAMGWLGIGAVVLYVTGSALVVLAALFTNWLWALATLGVALVGALGIYGCVKTGILGLLWQAAVAAKHGGCPPVTILREEP